MSCTSSHSELVSLTKSDRSARIRILTWILLVLTKNGTMVLPRSLSQIWFRLIVWTRVPRIVRNDFTKIL